MTLPDERWRSLIETRRFLHQLLSPRMTPRVPQAVRDRAHSLLRHWPDDYHLEKMTIDMPFDFTKEMEPLYRMVKQREQERNEEVTQPMPQSQENTNW